MADDLASADATMASALQAAATGGGGGRGLPPDLDVPAPQQGSVYEDFEALRYAVNAWALRDRFLSRIHKKDASRAIYVCRKAGSADCKWRVRANLCRDRSTIEAAWAQADRRRPLPGPTAVIVTVVHTGHSCPPGDFGPGDFGPGDPRPDGSRPSEQAGGGGGGSNTIGCGIAIHGRSESNDNGNNHNTNAINSTNNITNNTTSNDPRGDRAQPKPKYAKRGVQFTQRWVKDAMARAGFVVTTATDPTDIVRLIEDRYGVTVSAKLALKSRNSCLLASGQLPAVVMAAAPAPHPAPPLPDHRQHMQQRREAAELATTQSRSRSRDARLHAPPDRQAHPLPAQRENGSTGAMLQNLDPRLGALASALPSRSAGDPTALSGNATGASMSLGNGVGNGVGNGAGNGTGIDMSPGMHTTQTVQCATCLGAGVVHLPIAGYRSGSGPGPDAATDGAVEMHAHLAATIDQTATIPTTAMPSVVDGGDDELALLQRQVSLINRQIELVQQQRRRHENL